MASVFHLQKWVWFATATTVSAFFACTAALYLPFFRTPSGESVSMVHYVQRSTLLISFPFACSVLVQAAAVWDSVATLPSVPCSMMLLCTGRRRLCVWAFHLCFSVVGLVAFCTIADRIAVVVTDGRGLSVDTGYVVILSLHCINVICGAVLCRVYHVLASRSSLSRQLREETTCFGGLLWLPAEELAASNRSGSYNGLNYDLDGAAEQELQEHSAEEKSSRGVGSDDETPPLSAPSLRHSESLGSTSSQRRLWTILLPALCLLATIVVFIVFRGEGSASCSIGYEDLRRFSVPPGFDVTMFASKLPVANRQLAVTRYASFEPNPAHIMAVKTAPTTESTQTHTASSGDVTVVFAGSWQGTVLALVDADGDGFAEMHLRVAQGLVSPIGVALHGTSLYVGESPHIRRFPAIKQQLESGNIPLVSDIVVSLPTQHRHSGRYLAVEPSGVMCTGIGMPCNICDRNNPYGSIYCFVLPNPAAGSTAGTTLHYNNTTPVAHGIRNSVGLAFDLAEGKPSANRLWFTDNGRDWLGDDTPPGELNVLQLPSFVTVTGSKRTVRSEGMQTASAVPDFGFPYCYGHNVPDPEFNGQRGCSYARFRPVVLALQAHVAPLGLAFYYPPTAGPDSAPFPSKYHNHLFVTEHGSWNRQHHVGSKVLFVQLSDDRRKVKHVEDFMTGFVRGNVACGTPADVQTMPDGSLLVSDDHSHNIYRVARSQEF